MKVWQSGYDAHPYIYEPSPMAEVTLKTLADHGDIGGTLPADRFRTADQSTNGTVTPD